MLFGARQRDLVPFGAIWSHLEPFKTFLSHMEPFGAIWSHLESFGAILSYLEPFVAIWNHLDLFLLIPLFLLFHTFLTSSTLPTFPIFLMFLLYTNRLRTVHFLKKRRFMKPLLYCYYNKSSFDTFCSFK